MKFIVAALIASFVSAASYAQVPAPKPEHFLHHLFGRHHDSDDELERRSEALSCALVLIVAGNEMGTGFYVSRDGDIATAAHVLGNKIFIPLNSGQMQIVITGPDEISIKDSSHDKPQIYKRDTVLDKNGDAWSADVALLRTGAKPPCWLKTEGDENVRTGEHVVTIGFPGLAFGSLSLYSGIVSGRLRTGFPIGKTVLNQPITSNVDFIRVQMPISPGLSGAPIVDDQNRAIGIVTSAGAWSQDLDLLLQWEHVRESHPPDAPNHSPDLQSMVGELAEMFHDYGSPGYGDAVPMHYLKKALEANPSPATNGH